MLRYICLFFNVIFITFYIPIFIKAQYQYTMLGVPFVVRDPQYIMLGVPFVVRDPQFITKFTTLCAFIVALTAWRAHTHILPTPAYRYLYAPARLQNTL
jgi:hypothetical protein